MKKLLGCLITFGLIVSLWGCSSTSSTDYSNQVLTGKITSIEDNKITLALGTIEQSEQSQSSDMDPNGGNGSTDSSTSGMPMSEGESMPSDIPTGDGNSMPTDGQPSDMGGGNGGSMPTDGQAGDIPSGGSSDVPEMPSGDGNSSGMPTMPSDMGGDMSGTMGMMAGYTFTESGETLTIDISDVTVIDADELSLVDLEVDDVVYIYYNSSNKVTTVIVETMLSGNSSSGGGQSGSVDQGSSANTISEDATISNETYTSTGDDENALRIDGATVTLDGITVDKSAGSSSNAENGDFYGVNAAVLATNGATVTIKNATITSSTQNGNGVFSYGSGTTVNISDSTITTTADNSGGIQTTGGGTTNATNLTVETSGTSAAAIRSDRGGGTVNVDQGTYTSNGLNSPAVYSTATISVSNATLTANDSEAIVIEGQNSVSLDNCVVSGKMNATKGSSSSVNVHNIMIYQSMSGDAEVGTSSFSAKDCTITSNSGDMFYITNTACTIDLENTTFINNSADSLFMKIASNTASQGWGTAGKNGGTVTMTMTSQSIEGDIEVDDISSLDLTMKSKSTLTGTINITSSGYDATGSVNVTIESGCVWNLTGNCTISTLTNNGTINYNGYTITLADGTVLK